MSDRMKKMSRVDFSDWLRAKLREDDRNQAWLAERSGLSQGYLSKVMNGERMVGHDACVAIARALGLRDIEVLRVANLADPEPPTDTPTIREMNQEFAYLTTEEQEFWLGMLKTYVAERKRGYTVSPQGNSV